MFYRIYMIRHLFVLGLFFDFCTFLLSFSTVLFAFIPISSSSAAGVGVIGVTLTLISELLGTVSVFCLLDVDVV